jgi:hypothetical protein
MSSPHKRHTEIEVGKCYEWNVQALPHDVNNRITIVYDKDGLDEHKILYGASVGELKNVKRGKTKKDVPYWTASFSSPEFVGGMIHITITGNEYPMFFEVPCKLMTQSDVILIQYGLKKLQDFLNSQDKSKKPTPRISYTGLELGKCYKWDLNAMPGSIQPRISILNSEDNSSDAINACEGEFIGMKQGSQNVALFRCPSYDVDDIISIKITGGALPFFSEVPCSPLGNSGTTLGGTRRKRSGKRRSVRRRSVRRRSVRRRSVRRRSNRRS